MVIEPLDVLRQRMEDTYRVWQEAWHDHGYNSPQERAAFDRVKQLGLRLAEVSVEDDTEQMRRTLLGIGNRRRAYEILRAYFHALRDRLPVDEVAQLGAQLPMLLRGGYYEGRDPSHKPRKMDAEEFLEHIAKEAVLVGPGEAEGAVWAATRVLRRHIAEGEVDQVSRGLPEDIRHLLGKVRA